MISRRSDGLSIGINLSPDAACNFNCVYCQVDRSTKRQTHRVDPSRVAEELRELISLARDGALFDDPAFSDVPDELRTIKDIAFSGDGEPTACKRFLDCVEAAAQVKRDEGLDEVKLALFTNACYLTKPKVVAGLEVLDGANGVIWAKLDAGTEAYFER